MCVRAARILSSCLYIEPYPTYTFFVVEVGSVRAYDGHGSDFSKCCVVQPVCTLSVYSGQMVRAQHFPAHVRDFNQMMNAENAIKSGIVVVHSISFIATQNSPAYSTMRNMCEIYNKRGQSC